MNKFKVNLKKISKIVLIGAVVIALVIMALQWNYRRNVEKAESDTRTFVNENIDELNAFINNKEYKKAEAEFKGVKRYIDGYDPLVVRFSMAGFGLSISGTSVGFLYTEDINGVNKGFELEKLENDNWYLYKDSN